MTISKRLDYLSYRAGNVLICPIAPDWDPLKRFEFVSMSQYSPRRVFLVIETIGSLHAEKMIGMLPNYRERDDDDNGMWYMTHRGILRIASANHADHIKVIK